MPLVFRKPSFWVIMLLHLSLLVIDQYYFELPLMDGDIIIGLPASLLIFLTVFYNGNCYTRFFELWSLACDINAIVQHWVLQTTFIFEEMEIDAKATGTTSAYSRNPDRELDVQWDAVRRVISSMYMLFMSLDVDCTEFDLIGRAKQMPNLLQGDGLDEDDCNMLQRLGLVTEEELNLIKHYSGFKCQLPMKWAMNELRTLCQPEDRTKNQAKNYEALQEVAEQFNTTAIKIVTLMQQPVPFVYFHVLKLMMLLVNGLVSFEIVKLFGHDWPLSFLILGISASMLFGLQEIAVAMSDPFGTDASDFDTHKLCADAYANTVAYIKAKQAPLGKGGKLATNPLRDKIVFSVRKDSA